MKGFFPLQRVILAVLCVFCLAPSAGVAEEASSFVLPQYSQKISLDLKDADLKDILKAFSRQINSNFMLDQDVPALKITVLLNDVPVEEALDKILSVNGLTYEFDQSMNLFVIKKKALDESQKVVSRIFKLRYASVDSSKLKAAVNAAPQAGTLGGAGAVAAPAAGPAGGIISALKSILSKQGQIIEDPRTNSLIISDIQQNFVEIERMIARLDVPVKQVLIQVEMLDVSKTSADTVGAKFNLSTTMEVAPASISTAWPFSEDHLMDKWGGTRVGSSGKVTFTDVSMALDFLKSRDDTKSLARPRIITMDNETASIQISTDEAIGVTTQTSSSSSGTGTTSVEAERHTTGVLLSVTPQVNELTNEITLVAEPKVIDANSRTTFGAVSFANPEERSVKVTLRVANGQTVVIGGLLRKTMTSSRTGIPFLSDIPVLGAPFRHKDESNRDRELMIFLTPYVLDSDRPIPSELKKGIEASKAAREQSFPDARQGLIDKEMDKATKGPLSKSSKQEL